MALFHQFTLTWLVSSICFGQETGNRFAHLGQFRLEETTLDEIQQKLGDSPLIEKGEAGDYEATICYRNRGVFVTFLSGEMGGRNHGLLGFSVRRDLTGIAHAKVPKSRISIPITVAGLRLGMTKSEFERVVAKKVEWSGNTGSVVYGWKIPLTQADIDRMEMAQEELRLGRGPLFFDASLSVDVTFSSNRLVAFQVWKVTSF